jgi:hypothetical protein
MHIQGFVFRSLKLKTNDHTRIGTYLVSFINEDYDNYDNTIFRVLCT